MKLTIGKKRLFRFHLTSENKIGLLLVSSLFFGVIAGSLVIPFSDDVHSILIGYAQSITSTAPAANILLNDFIISFLFFLALFLLGMSVYGYIFVPVLPFIKGFSYGFSAAFFYAVFGARGILVCALGLLPQAFIFSAALLMGSYLAFVKSRSFRSRESSRSYHDGSIKRYCLTFLALFFTSFMTVLLDIFATGRVINLFC